MPTRILAHRPYGTIELNMASTNITNAAWVQLSAALPWSACALEVFNPSAALMRLSMGAAGHETDPGQEFPYTILPGGSEILLPFEFKKGSRLAVITVDQTANTGYLVLNFFG